MCTISPNLSLYLLVDNLNPREREDARPDEDCFLYFLVRHGRVGDTKAQVFNKNDVVIYAESCKDMPPVSCLARSSACLDHGYKPAVTLAQKAEGHPHSVSEL